MQEMVFFKEAFGNVSSALLRAGTQTQRMEELLGHKEVGSKSFCMGLEPTCTQESKAMVGIKSTRSFQALRHYFSKNFLGGGKKKIDEAHYTIQTQAWQLPAWSSEFQHKNVQHAANLGMGRNNPAARRLKI